MTLDAAAQRPKFTENEAVKLAQKLYGIMTLSARELPGDRDQNFYLEEAGGAAYVLKIASSADEEAILDLQNKVLLHIAGQEEFAGSVPRLVETAAGRSMEVIPGEGGQVHFVRLLTHLPGELLATVKPQTVALLAESGNLFGRLDAALQDFKHPAMERRLHWYLDQAPETLAHYAGYIKEPQKRALVDYFLARFTAEVTPLLPVLRRSVIHSDGNDHNILVSTANAKPRHVVGVIDFGDVVHTCTVFEPAILTAYLMLDKEDPAAAAAAVIGGYHRALPLTEQEIALLPALIAIRLCISVSFSAYRQTLEPHNAYFSVSERPAWEMLARLAEMSPGVLHNALRAACGFDLLPAYETPTMSKEEILARRKRVLGPSLSLSYEKPLQIVRGMGQYLYDESGRRYLDGVNNVCHVGHSHPHVVAALAEQAALLNTNTRYLHPNIVRYAERLLAKLPAPLEVLFFVCSGSEANELALRLARTYTDAQDLIVLDGAYHGNTAALIDASPYKHNGPGGKGAPDFIHMAMLPDPYRGPYKGYGRDTGLRYAVYVQELVEEITNAERKLAGFIVEPLQSCGGQIVFPEGYLQEALAQVRAVGGVCIADEVQVGFGRVGSYFWGFETQGVVPDLVTMGKPIGNGHPLAAVATTRAIAEAFANGMEYFNTFGGNPVSCAVGSAVLDVIEKEDLQENALRVGDHLMQGLRGLMDRHALIGDVRGLGLFIGVEFVRDRKTLEPAAEEARYIIERMKEEGILLSIDGLLHNVLKLKPPLVFSLEDADLLVDTLDKVLGEV
ncbi:MAG: aminotransferase class III-fold pyridoxal phosphate-dependent enzyme [Candidatus Promineifilaceae bacterium]|jgi:4-aminobutyrate aminotransferase-like enzyme/Ser/Thr protein kinase RdoA (MazF antagonist)